MQELLPRVESGTETQSSERMPIGIIGVRTTHAAVVKKLPRSQLIDLTRPPRLKVERLVFLA